MAFLTEWWGTNDNIRPLEIAARAMVMFVITVIVIRVTGMRAFRRNNPFELVIVFLIGGILSRGVVGATPFFSSIAGAIAIIVLQKLLSRLSFYSKWFETATKGERILIYEDGVFIKENMKKADITEKEVFEDVRVEFQSESLDKFKQIFVEKTGEISFVTKENSEQ